MITSRSNVLFGIKWKHPEGCSKALHVKAYSFNFLGRFYPKPNYKTINKKDHTEKDRTEKRQNRETKNAEKKNTQRKRTHEEQKAKQEREKNQTKEMVDCMDKPVRH
jgi:hypothetical protein